MASNSFGNIFRFTTWGESHGKSIGVVIDGCPAGVAISEKDINNELARRAPGGAYTSPRKEKDVAEILSGVFDGITTGTPISIIIKNMDTDSSKYEPIKDLLRPGHANFTYLNKYGVYDYRGGGRSSARETACRAAAGAVAKLLLSTYSIKVCAFLSSVGTNSINTNNNNWNTIIANVNNSPLFCPDAVVEEEFKKNLLAAKSTGDSLGGVVSFIVLGLPIGLGEPVYSKLEALLASAMLSIPASKGFEIGEGFVASRMTGTGHNDLFTNGDDKTVTLTNHAGGTLGGISTGMPLFGRVAFKPTSSIMLPQSTINIRGKTEVFQLPKGSRHDPCVAIRAVPVVEAMCAVTIADLLLLNRCSKLFTEAGENLVIEND